MSTGHPKLVARLNLLMQEKGLNGADLRRMAKVNQTGVYDILDGTTRSPRLETVEKLARALGTSVAYLIGESDVREEAQGLLQDYAAMDPADREQLRALAARFAQQKRGAA